MISRRQESELLALRKLAEDFAAQRRETATSAHLLAAIASRPSAAADLLAERRLDADRLIRAARAVCDDDRDPVRRAIERAREVAARMGAREPHAVHLLVALLSDRRCAGHRALDQCGIDVNRLRVAAMNVGLGLVGRRRIVTRRDGQREESRVRPAARLGQAVRVPLFPPAALRTGASKGDPGPAAAPPESSVPSGVEASASGDAPSPRDDALPSDAPPAPAKTTRPATRPRKNRTGATGSRFSLDSRMFPTLCSLGANLTLAAEQGNLDPVVGRDDEVEQTLDVLAKRHGNNPCLVGVAGVGKTSVVRGLARRIAEADAVGSLDDRIIVEVPISELVAGTGVRGALAQRLGALRKEVIAAQGRVVVFFDEIHQLFVGDLSEEIAGDLKVALSRGELPCIGATTHDEYARVIDADPALARRFSVVEVPELGREESFLVLDALAPTFEKHHGVGYAEEALAAAIAWSVRYLPGRALPDKAVSVLDLAGARTRRRGGSEVTPEVVAEVVAEAADMPIERLLETDAERMLRLEELLADRVVGHADAIRRIARILRRNAAGLGSRRPIGTFLLLGPTGVGKTETAKAIAETLFFTESAMTRIDMSEYGEAHAASRLIGAPPGYVGFESGGQLTEAVRRRPYQVILLDEVEKAHPEVLETFLAVFDEGRLTDGRGRTVDFTNTVILITSNIGADVTQASRRRRVGFGADERGESRLDEAVVARARDALAPELYNRLDEVLVFSPLGRAEVRDIATRMLHRIGSELEAERGVRLLFDAAAIEALLDAGGFDPTLGARPMKRTIARLVEAPLAEHILRGALGPDDTATLRAVEGRLVVEASGDACAAE